jgi:F1F0 ATPase subunit 2
MNDVPGLMLMFGGGALLGAVYLAGLWLTVRRLHRHPHAALWFAVSLMVRMAAVVTGFYLILAAGRWQYLLAGLAGFVTLRTLLIWRVNRGLSGPGVDKRRAA